MQVHVTRHDFVPGVVVAAMENVREHDLDLPLRAVRRVAAVESVVQLGKLLKKTHTLYFSLDAFGKYFMIPCSLENIISRRHNTWVPVDCPEGVWGFFHGVPLKHIGY